MKLPFWLYYLLGCAAFSLVAEGIFLAVDTDMPAGVAAFSVVFIWLAGTAAYLVLGTLAIEVLKFLTDPKESFQRLTASSAAILLGLMRLGVGVAGLIAFGYGVHFLGNYVEDKYLTEWDCVESGDSMYAVSEKGEIGPAEKACTCTGMADFERRKFGRVDYASLNKDHGCNFD